MSIIKLSAWGYLGIFREIRQATKESQLPTDQSRRADLITTEKSMLEIHYIILELLSQQKARKKMSVLDAILIFTAGAFCSYLHSYVKELEREDY